VVKRAVFVAEALLAAQRESAAVIAAAERVLAIEPSHEGAWRALMQAYLQRGERGAAMEAYERCSAILAESSGVLPSADTQALLGRIQEWGPMPQPPSELPAGAAGAIVEAAQLGGVLQQKPAASSQPGAPPAPQKPAIRLGVMPFRSLYPGHDDELALGLAEETTTALSRFSWFSLISSTSVAALSGEPREGNSRWRWLDLDALLDGTVQRGGGRIRVTVRLLDMRAAGEVIWTRRFDRPADDLLALQDEIAAETAAQVDPELLLREGRRATSSPPSNPRAYDLLLRAIPAIYRLDQPGFRAAGETLAAAAALDPDYAPVQAWWAYWHLCLVGQGWADDPAAAIVRTGELAERAVALDPSDARALTIAGHVRAFLRHQLQEAFHLHDRALSLNPNLPLAWVFSGMAHSYAGSHEEAIRRIHRARRLSPFDPHGFVFDMALMIPHLARGEYDTVVDLGRRATLLNPTLSSTQKGYLSALGHLGQSEEQVVVRARLLGLEPAFTVSEALLRSPYLCEHDRLLYTQGLRSAGLPE